MTNNGKAQVSAPKCNQETQVVVPEPTGSLKIFSTGDSTVTSAYPAPAAGAAGATIQVANQTGFTAGTIIIAPGTDKEEEATISTTGVVGTNANLTITSLHDGTYAGLNYSHAVGTRIVMKRAAIRPGSVKFQEIGVAAADAVPLDPNGTGTATQVDVGDGVIDAVIDYALGSINIPTSAGDAPKDGAANFIFDRLADTPADIASGKNFFKNFARMSNGRADLPTGAVISNLGAAEVGVFVESTQSSDASAFTNNQNSANAVIKGFGSKVVTFEGGMPAEMRIRAGAASQASMTPTTATERNNDPGVIDVAYFSVINANGGSN